jgi:hypothetical protein
LPGWLRPSVGVSLKKFHGLISACTRSVGMIGHSSARATWGVPVVSQTPLSVFTIGSVSGDAQTLNFAVPVEWIKELPQRHERLNAKAAASGPASAASR